MHGEGRIKFYSEKVIGTHLNRVCLCMFVYEYFFFSLQGGSSSVWKKIKINKENATATFKDWTSVFFFFAHFEPILVHWEH